MPTLVDLTAAPYHLDADQIAWVDQHLVLGVNELLSLIHI